MPKYPYACTKNEHEWAITWWA